MVLFICPVDFCVSSALWGSVYVYKKSLNDNATLLNETIKRKKPFGRVNYKRSGYFCRKNISGEKALGQSQIFFQCFKFFAGFYNEGYQV